MPWYQKKVASVIFATPPTSTYKEVFILDAVLIITWVRAASFLVTNLVDYDGSFVTVNIWLHEHETVFGIPNSMVKMLFRVFVLVILLEFTYFNS